MMRRPTVESVAPDSGFQVGGYPLVIRGSGFTTATEVQFGWGNDATFTIDSDTQITATVPPGDAGYLVNIVVTNVNDAIAAGAMVIVAVSLAPVIVLSRTLRTSR